MYFGVLFVSTFRFCINSMFSSTFWYKLCIP